MAFLQSVDFHVGTSSSSIGIENEISQRKGSNIVINADYNVTGATITFEVQGRASKNGNNWTEIKGLDLTDGSFSAEYTLTGIGAKLYQIDVTGVYNMRVVVSDFTGTAITVLGDIYDG